MRHERRDMGETVMVTQAVLADYKELLDFENRIFGVRFLTKVPKLYTDEAFCVSCHGIIKQNEAIVGGIAAYPTTLTTLGGTLRAIGIGSVAVDPAARGRGYMKELMAYCDDVAAREGAAFAFLSGHRQRYAHYGYAPCGTRYLFDISDYFIDRHAVQKALSFETLKKSPEVLTALLTLFHSQPYHWARTAETFERITATWEEKCYIIRDEKQTLCGYLIVEKTKRDISELVLRPDISAADALTAFARSKRMKKLRLCVNEGQRMLLRGLAAFGERPEIQVPVKFKVYDFERMIAVLGTHRAQTSALLEGSLVLRIDDKTYRITVADSRCTVEPTDAAPDLSLNAQEAAAALTTPFGMLLPHPLLSAWAPLCPLGIPHCDEI